METASELPIHAHREEIVSAVRGSQCVVITGETGCGKTTQLPQFLLAAGLGEGGMIGVTQPRRVAAVSVARRVAQEMGARLGGAVGYQVRFDDQTSRETRIKYMTDGCLLREMLEDPTLSRYSVVVLDEAHERSLATDILFGLVRALLVRPAGETRRLTPLRVVVMSATLDSEKFSRFFSLCPVFSIPGRTFPVETEFCVADESFDVQKPTYVAQVTRVVMEIHLDQPKGDVLVFVTGQQEIESVCDRLFKLAEDIDYQHDVQHSSIEGLLILPLYGAMAPEHQQRVFEPAPNGIRRVIVATNIAATSVTVDGVVYVIDSGYVKQLSYSPRTGLDSLEIVPIAKSEAIQRSGRAGRTAPGKCFRLYSRRHFDSLAENTVPEIQRTSLTAVVLDLKCLGVANVLAFHYLDPPEEGMLMEALRQLFYFQAIDEEGRVTPLGRRLVEFPLQPSLARVLVRAKELCCEEAALPIVAMLSVENVYVRPSSKGEVARAAEVHTELARAGGGNSDFASLLAIYTLAGESGRLRQWCRDHFVNWRAVKTAQSVHQQLETILTRQAITADPAPGALDAPLGVRVRQSLCFGLFGSVARVSATQRSFHTMDGHSTITHLHPSSVLFGREKSLDWVVYHELVDTARAYMRTVCPIRYAWVSGLLPRLHDVDVYRLSDCERKRSRGEGEAEEGEECKRVRTCRDDMGQENRGASSREKLAERAESARARYLDRKSLRQS